MPNISKQVAKPVVTNKPTASNGDLNQTLGLKVSIYGRSKTAKTSLATDFPKPLLLFGLEDGTKSIATSRKEKKRLPGGSVIHELFLRGKSTGVDFCRIMSSSQFDELVPLITSDGYRSSVIDHGGGLQDVIVKEVLGLENVPVQKSYGMMDRQTWGLVAMQWKERVSGLMNLADNSGHNVVVIAHERNFTEDGTSSDVMLPSVGSALTPTITGWLNGACDYICQCFLRQETREETQDMGDGGDKLITLVPTGKVEYCLRTGPHAIYSTGFRVPRGTPLPDVITDPSYAKLVEIIEGRYKPVRSSTPSAVKTK